MMQRVDITEADMNNFYVSLYEKMKLDEGFIRHFDQLEKFSQGFPEPTYAKKMMRNIRVGAAIVYFAMKNAGYTLEYFPPFAHTSAESITYTRSPEM